MSDRLAPGRTSHSSTQRLLWLAGVKVLALLGVVVNHIAESFWFSSGVGSLSWLSTPDGSLQTLSERLQAAWPAHSGLADKLMWLLAWVGNEGPGVFLLLSGLGLTLAATGGARGAPFSSAAFFQRRLLRLYPLYLVSVLLFVPVWILAAPSLDWSLAGLPGLAMLSGVRASPALFSLLNPSWWFFWTLLQLYLIFPVLLFAVRRFGYLPVFMAAIVLTWLARAVVLAWASYEVFWPWMTGLFAATRLAEFVAGMAIAHWMASDPKGWRTLHAWRGGLCSTLLFMAAAAISFTMPGAVVGQLPLTLGLTGVLLFSWQLAVARFPATTRVAALESSSYGIYLLHQPLLIILARLSGQATWGVLAAVATIMALPWVVSLIERLIAMLSARGTTRPWPRIVRVMLTVGAVAVLFVVPVIEPYLSGRPRGLLTWLLAVFVVLACWWEWQHPDRGRGHLVRLAAMVCAALTLWVFPDKGAGVATLIALTTLLFAWFAWRMTGRRVGIGSFTSVTGLLLAAMLLENTAIDGKPSHESHVWGELPVLTTHPSRGYALKPSVDTVLNYHYEYRVQTNSDGFQGRPVTARTPSGQPALRIALLGDAFTMPEAIDSAYSYASLLDNQLNRCITQRDVQVFNLGVTGYSPTEKLVLANEVLPILQPDLVIDQIFPAELDWMQMDRLARWQDIGLAPNPAITYREAWQSLSVYDRLMRWAGDLAEVYGGLPARWRYETALIGYFRQDNREQGGLASGSALSGYWTAMRKQGSAAGYRFMALYTPLALEVMSPGQLDYMPSNLSHPLIGTLDHDQPFQVMERAAKRAGIRLLDPRVTLRGAALAGLQVYSPRYWHWERDGHRVAADFLVNALVDAELVPASCRRQPAAFEQAGSQDLAR